MIIRITPPQSNECESTKSCEEQGHNDLRTTEIYTHVLG